MWIIFGWEKTTRSLGVAANTYCYDCRRQTPWEVSNTSEWVTLSAIRVFRFIYKHHLHCSSCLSFLTLTAAEFKQIDRIMRTSESIDGSPIHATLAARIEKEQLATKTPTQLKFIRETMAAQREYRERIEAQDLKERVDMERENA